MKNWIESQVPLKRFGSTAEIANAVLFLTSSESSYIVGTELIVDGGMVGSISGMPEREKEPALSRDR